MMVSGVEEFSSGAQRRESASAVLAAWLMGDNEIETHEEKGPSGLSFSLLEILKILMIC